MSKSITTTIIVVLYFQGHAKGIELFLCELFLFQFISKLNIFEQPKWNGLVNCSGFDLPIDPHLQRKLTWKPKMKVRKMSIHVKRGSYCHIGSMSGKLLSIVCIYIYKINICVYMYTFIMDPTCRVQPTEIPLPSPTCPIQPISSAIVVSCLHFLMEAMVPQPRASRLNGWLPEIFLMFSFWNGFLPK